MITMPNGVTVFDKLTEWENTDTSKMNGVVVYIGQDVWAVQRPINALGSCLTVRCDSKQDAIDVAAMFADRANGEAHCAICANNGISQNDSLYKCGKCCHRTKDAPHSQYELLQNDIQRGDSCEIRGTRHCEKHCKKPCDEKGDAA